MSNPLGITYTAAEDIPAGSFVLAGLGRTLHVGRDGIQGIAAGWTTRDIAAGEAVDLDDALTRAMSVRISTIPASPGWAFILPLDAQARDDVE